MFCFDDSLKEGVAWRYRSTNSRKPFFKIQVFSLQQRNKINLLDYDTIYSVRWLFMFHFMVKHGSSRPPT